MDAMSDAIDNAEMMLYAVSERYKESGNVRRQDVLRFMWHLSNMVMFSVCIDVNVRYSAAWRQTTPTNLSWTWSL